MTQQATNNAAAKATETHHSGTTATAPPTSTGETESSAPFPITLTSDPTKSAVAKVSARSSQMKTSAPVVLPSQAVVHPLPSLRSFWYIDIVIEMHTLRYCFSLSNTAVSIISIHYPNFGIVFQLQIVRRGNKIRQNYIHGFMRL